MKIKPGRILAHPFPTTPELQQSQIVKRLREAAARASSNPESEDIIEWDAIEDDWEAPASPEEEVFDLSDPDPAPVGAAPQRDLFAVAPKPERASPEARARRRAASYIQRRKAHLKSLLAHLDRHETALIAEAVGQGHVAGIVGQHQMHEKIAALHEGAPWLSRASSAVMAAMHRATEGGSAGLTMTPLILSGPPGIGKSQWARELARLFAVPTVEVDVGATNGATFALSGVERGWGSAGPGRLVETMLRTRIANPVVIVDEIDKIPDSVMTNKGTTLPGAFEVLKSMIEPTTARAWTCPYYRVPFNLSAVNWVMTTNSSHMLPAAFRDRCKVIELKRPTQAQLLAVARSRIDTTFPPELRAIAEPLVTGVLRKRERTFQPTSLRQLGRILDRIREIDDRQMLM